uniref:F-box domain-containing protein n=1 Tax=Anopheles dirus TaxID=7168 RepID=A0A182NPP5_9DIPT
MNVAARNYHRRQCMYYMQREQNVKHRSHTVGLEEIAHILQHSTRNYTTLHLDVFYDELHDVHMNSVLNTVFNEDWTSRLRILKLGLGSSSERYAPAISAALPKMVGLKDLLLICAATFPATKYFPDLRLENDTLERLVLLTVLPGVINCPKLRVLQVSAHLDVESAFGKQYAQHAGEEPFWKVRQLEHFTINLQNLPKCGAADDPPSQTENRPGYKMQFYQQLTKLQKLEIYEVPVPQKVFQGICEHCSSLEELTLHDLNLIDPEALQDLSKLSRLQRLAIYKLHTTRPISFANVQAPRLVEVRLGREVQVHRDSQQHLKHLIVNVKKPYQPIRLTLAS